MIYKSKRIIDIVDEILFRRDALAPYLGDEVSESLLNETNHKAGPTLFVIDLRKANPVDYSFMKAAFGKFYELIFYNDSAHDAIFLLKPSHVQHLLWGIMSHLRGNNTSSGDAITDFESEYHIKLSTDDETLRFIAGLNQNELNLLNQINKQGNTDTYQLIQHFRGEIPPDVITSSLHQLKGKKFIHFDEENIYAIRLI